MTNFLLGFIAGNATAADPVVVTSPIHLPSSIPNITLDTFTGNLFQLIALILGVAAFAGIVYSGFLMITSGGDAAKFVTARKNLVWAIIGIIIITLSYFIVTTVFNIFSNPANLSWLTFKSYI